MHDVIALTSAVSEAPSLTSGPAREQGSDRSARDRVARRVDAVDRARLVRLCTQLSGDRCLAEDLAQETLVEAWRHCDRIRDPGARSSWLAGIARNVCRRRAAQGSHDRARLVSLDELTVGTSGQPPGWHADSVDLESELERDELAALLDRSLAKLPAETRLVLVGRCVEDVPISSLAARLGVSEDAVSMRVARGKRALRRILETSFEGEAIAFGLVEAGRDAWRETRIWCPDCGRRRLWGRFTREGDFQLDCVGCDACDGRPRNVQVRGRTAELLWRGTTLAQAIEGVKGYKPTLNRISARLWEFYRHGIIGQTAACPRCGHASPLRRCNGAASRYSDVQVRCDRCGASAGVSNLSGVALSMPESVAFWRRHSRIRTRPAREVEACGSPAVVVTFGAVAASQSLEIVFGRDSLRLLSVNETGDAS